MAERRRSKQRRQARNRAEREARAARSRAANTPPEERRAPASEPAPRRGRRRRTPDADVPEQETRAERRERRRRERVSPEQIQARAREVLDASDTESSQVDADTEPDPVSVPTARRGSPVFSARHRAAVAEATADAAPARTHQGVADATGVEAAAPRGPGGRPVRATAGTSRDEPRPSAARSRDAAPAGTSRTRTTSSRSTTPPARASSTRNPNRPPPRPMPAWLDRFGGNEPGGRWVMMSFAMVLMASVIINFVHIVPEIVEIDGKKEQTGQYFTIWHYGIGPGLYFLLPPIIILGLFILTARPWDRRRSWNMALGCLVFITFITQSISIFIVPIGALAWGCWQARKAALEEVGGDPRVLREVERERRIAGRDALRAARGRPSRQHDDD